VDVVWHQNIPANLDTKACCFLAELNESLKDLLSS